MARQAQEQRQELSTSLSPAQIQAIKMLELTGLELEARIERELEENPALEEGYDEGIRADEDEELEAREQDWELGEYATEDDIPAYKLRELQERQSKQEDIPFAASAPSLDESLLEQLRMEGLSDRDEEIARYIIGNISSEGYLTRSVYELQDDLLFKADLEVALGELEALIERIRHLEPAGIGARDLRDCLILQLERRLSSQDDRLAMDILRNSYDDFANKRFDRLVERWGVSRDRLTHIYHLISRLNPKPGIEFASIEEERMLHYNPDFVVTAIDDELVLSLVGEREVVPLRLSPQYLQMLEMSQGEGNRRKEREAREFVKHKLDQARWFIEAVAQRQSTLRRTMLAIMAHQRAFFLSGELADLRPMILKDIAEATSLDISTISRVSNSKSVQTDYGVYPLKFFFGEGRTSDDGEEITTRAIKQMIADLIASEDKQRPYTDEELAQLLADEGYPLARRTIAKYRELLRLPVARLRREV